METEVNTFLCCYLLCINLYQFEIQQHGARVIIYVPLSINKGVAFKNHCVTKSHSPLPLSSDDLFRVRKAAMYIRHTYDISGHKYSLRDVRAKYVGFLSSLEMNTTTSE